VGGGVSERVRLALVWLAALVAIALTARLGVWQLDRAEQKLAWQQATERQRALPALKATELPARAERVPGLVHRAVSLRGRWIAERTVFLENRQMNGQPGFYVLTPLALDGGAALMVQRGWWPRDVIDRTRVSAPAPPAGEVAVDGRIALGPARLAELGADAAGPLRQNLDLAAYARETGLALLPMLVVQEEPAASVPPVADGLMREWPRPETGIAKHHGYAAQWFGLSALVVGLTLWFRVLRPRLRRSAAPS
jgi:surfeit locus 1 family protein